MADKINNKLIKLIKYYSLINYNLIYENKAINRYKNNNSLISSSLSSDLQNLRSSILSIKNCELKNSATNIVFSYGNFKA